MSPNIRIISHMCCLLHFLLHVGTKSVSMVEFRKITPCLNWTPEVVDLEPKLLLFWSVCGLRLLPPAHLQWVDLWLCYDNLFALCWSHPPIQTKICIAPQNPYPEPALGFVSLPTINDLVAACFLFLSPNLNCSHLWAWFCRVLSVWNVSMRFDDLFEKSSEKQFKYLLLQLWFMKSVQLKT